MPGHILASEVKEWAESASNGDMFVLDGSTALVCLVIDSSNRPPGPVKLAPAPAQEEKVVMEKPIKEPSISVDRQSSSIAIFDCFDLIRDFQDYTDEYEAVAEAKRWLKARTDMEPKMVYPHITKAVFSTGRRRR